MAVIGAYESGKSVEVPFTLDMLSFDKLTYSVADSAGNILLSDQDISTAGNEFSVIVTVPPELNEIDADKGLRRVTLTAVTGSTSVEFDAIYILMRSFELSVFEQSFATLDDALMCAIDIKKGDTVLAMDKMQLRRLLMEATAKIKTMPFSIRRIYAIDYDDYDRPQNMLNVREVSWGQEGQYRMDMIDWSLMTADNFNNLPTAFKVALMVATVNEVAEIASSSDSESARDEGIVSESIGETTLAYRQGKSATQVVNKTTWRLLMKYLNNRTVIRRS